MAQKILTLHRLHGSGDALLSNESAHIFAKAYLDDKISKVACLNSGPLIGDNLGFFEENPQIIEILLSKLGFFESESEALEWIKS